MDTRRLTEGRTLDEYTYRDPSLSLWQSAAHAVASRLEGLRASEAERQLATPVHAVHAVLSSALERGEALSGDTADFTALLGTGGECAKLVGELLWAQVSGDRAKAEELKAKLQYTVCDVPGWSECVTTYLQYEASHGPNPYRPGEDVQLPLPPNSKIAIVGDWGTGESIAKNVMQAVLTLEPDIVIHLGDIYYAGMPVEAERHFLNPYHEIFGPSKPVYSLCGNHDMYSGGAGYYALIDEIGQKASYFSLQNEDWRILAMDTGNNDRNPFSVLSDMTSLHDDEAEWQEANIADAKNNSQRIILLSHHQLFSPFCAVGRFDHGKKYAYNPNLYDKFKNVLGDVDLWFWGHEHTLAVYDEYMGLKRGRCIGASAIPVFLWQQSYRKDSSLVTYDGGGLPNWKQTAELGNNGTDYFHGFAFLQFHGKGATVDYYQVRPNKPQALMLHSEIV